MYFGEIYEVYNGEELIFTGTQREIWDKFKITNSLSHYADLGYKLLGRYTVKKCGKARLEYGAEPKLSDWEYLELHLVKRGLPNTTCNFDPSPYVEDLRKLGVEVKITKYEPRMYYSSLCQPKRGRKKYSWLVERKS